MAKPKKSRAQQTLPEHPLVTALLAELQASEERRCVRSDCTHS
jgi:hypothetical protein